MKLTRRLGILVQMNPSSRFKKKLQDYYCKLHSQSTNLWIDMDKKCKKGDSQDKDIMDNIQPRYKN